MARSKKTNSDFISLVIVFAVIVAAFYLYQMWSENISDDGLVNDVNNGENYGDVGASDWKEYSSSKYGISFKYPREGIFTEQEFDLGSPSFESYNVMSIDLPFNNQYNTWTRKSVVISVKEKKDESCSYISNLFQEKRNTYINNSAYAVSNPYPTETSGVSSVSKLKQYVTSTNRYCYSVAMILSGPGPASEVYPSVPEIPLNEQTFLIEEAEDMEDILNTVVVSGASTDYINEERGFRLTHPSNFKLTTSEYGRLVFKDDKGANHYSSFIIKIINPAEISVRGVTTSLLYDANVNKCYRKNYDGSINYENDEINGMHVCSITIGDVGGISIFYYFIDSDRNIAVGISSGGDNSHAMAPIERIVQTFSFL